MERGADGQGTQLFDNRKSCVPFVSSKRRGHSTFHFVRGVACDAHFNGASTRAFRCSAKSRMSPPNQNPLVSVTST
jgi:hypothetical protein